jgi:hypothetical protein
MSVPIQNNNNNHVSNFDSLFAEGQFEDPVSMDTMEGPIICSHGITYSRSTIQAQINASNVQGQFQCPNTGLYESAAIVNNLFANDILQARKKALDSEIVIFTKQQVAQINNALNQKDQQIQQLRSQLTERSELWGCMVERLVIKTRSLSEDVYEKTRRSLLKIISS